MGSLPIGVTLISSAGLCFASSRLLRNYQQNSSSFTRTLQGVFISNALRPFVETHLKKHLTERQIDVLFGGTTFLMIGLGGYFSGTPAKVNLFTSLAFAALQMGIHKLASACQKQSSPSSLSKSRPSNYSTPLPMTPPSSPPYSSGTPSDDPLSAKTRDQRTAPNGGASSSPIEGGDSKQPYIRTLTSEEVELTTGKSPDLVQATSILHESADSLAIEIPQDLNELILKQLAAFRGQQNKEQKQQLAIELVPLYKQVLEWAHQSEALLIPENALETYEQVLEKESQEKRNRNLFEAHFIPEDVLEAIDSPSLRTHASIQDYLMQCESYHFTGEEDRIAALMLSNSGPVLVGHLARIWEGTIFESGQETFKVSIPELTISQISKELRAFREQKGLEQKQKSAKQLLTFYTKMMRSHDELYTFHELTESLVIPQDVLESLSLSDLKNIELLEEYIRLCIDTLYLDEGSRVCALLKDEDGDRYENLVAWLSLARTHFDSQKSYKQVSSPTIKVFPTLPPETPTKYAEDKKRRFDTHPQNRLMASPPFLFSNDPEQKTPERKKKERSDSPLSSSSPMPSSIPELTHEQIQGWKKEQERAERVRRAREKREQEEPPSNPFTNFGSAFSLPPSKPSVRVTAEKPAQFGSAGSVAGFGSTADRQVKFISKIPDLLRSLKTEESILTRNRIAEDELLPMCREVQSDDEIRNVIDVLLKTELFESSLNQWANFCIDRGLLDSGVRFCAKIRDEMTQKILCCELVKAYGKKKEYPLPKNLRSIAQNDPVSIEAYFRYFYEPHNDPDNDPDTATKVLHDFSSSEKIDELRTDLIEYYLYEVQPPNFEEAQSLVLMIKDKSNQEVYQQELEERKKQLSI